MLPERMDQAISWIELQKDTKNLLGCLGDGRQDRYVVMRDNLPAAVLMSVAGYEALLTELVDLRLDALACERLATLPQVGAVSHADMSARFAVSSGDLGIMSATDNQRGKNE